MENPTVARNYAEVLAALANEAKDLDGWGVYMREVADACTTDETLRAFLGSPRVTVAQKSKIVGDAFGKKMPAKFVRFLQAVVMHRRQSLLQDIAIEYLSLVAITLIIINLGFVPGILVGIMIGCATFAFSASRVSVIKFSFDGSEYRSSLDRGPEELKLLTEHGRELQGMSLQSYLFFGSANQLYQHIKRLLASRPECRYLLFDFRLVTGVLRQLTASCRSRKRRRPAAPELCWLIWCRNWRRRFAPSGSHPIASSAPLISTALWNPASRQSSKHIRTRATTSDPSGHGCRRLWATHNMPNI